jgi:hypothetical protein
LERVLDFRGERRDGLLLKSYHVLLVHRAVLVTHPCAALVHVVLLLRLAKITDTALKVATADGSRRTDDCGVELGAWAPLQGLVALVLLALLVPTPVGVARVEVVLGALARVYVVVLVEQTLVALLVCLL